MYVRTHACTHTPEEVGSKDNCEIDWIHLVLGMMPADNVEVADEKLEESIVGGREIGQDIVEKL